MSKEIYAFKEWADICDLLAAGKTSLLIRKGGIHEGRDGFSFKHDQFLLFPTGFHQQKNGLTAEAMDALLDAPRIHKPVEQEADVYFEIFAVAEFAHLVREKTIVNALAPHHVWTPQVVDDRYSYSEKLEADCLSIALVRIYKLAKPWVVPYVRKFGGCRSWLDIENTPSGLLEGMTPVITDKAHQSRADAVQQLLGNLN